MFWFPCFGTFSLLSVLKIWGEALLLPKAAFPICCKKCRIPPFSIFFVGPGKTPLCNMSPAFGGNFLIASFSQETPYQNVEAHNTTCTMVSGKRRTASQLATHTSASGRVSFVWSRSSGLLGNVFSFLIMFSILVWTFVFCGWFASHPISNCFLSNTKSYS